MGGSMIFFKTLWHASTQPTSFFASVDRHESIGRLLWYLYRVVALSVALGLTYSLYLAPTTELSAQLTTNYGGRLPLYLATAVLIAPLALIAVQLVNAGISHGLCRLSGGHGTYRDSLAAIVYGASPNVLAGLSFVGMFTNLLVIYASWVGLAEFHRLSLWKTSIITLVSYFLTLTLLIQFII